MKAQRQLEEALAQKRREIDHSYSGMEEALVWDAEWKSKVTPVIQPTQETSRSQQEQTQGSARNPITNASRTAKPTARST